MLIAVIAQLGERQTEDLKVPGSIPGRGMLCIQLLNDCRCIKRLQCYDDRFVTKVKCVCGCYSAMLYTHDYTTSRVADPSTWQIIYPNKCGICDMAYYHATALCCDIYVI